MLHLTSTVKPCLSWLQYFSTLLQCTFLVCYLSSYNVYFLNNVYFSICNMCCLSHGSKVSQVTLIHTVSLTGYSISNTCPFSSRKSPTGQEPRCCGEWGSGRLLLSTATCLWLLVTPCSMAREQSQEQLPRRGRGKSSG